jgi:serine/threonine protein kinase
MALNTTKVAIAKELCHSFVDLRQPCERRTLIIKFKSPQTLAEMELRSLCTAQKNQQEYLPTVSSFGLLDEDDPALAKARLGTIAALRALKNMFEAEGTSTQYGFNDLLARTDEINETPVPPGQLRLGLYLAREFGALQMVGPSADGMQIESFMIAEQVVTIDDPAKAWASRVQSAKEAAWDGPPPARGDKGAGVRATGERPNKREPWLPTGWKIEKSLPEGGQGWTYLVSRLGAGNDELYVFKRLKNRDRAARIEAEIKALRMLSHPGILKIVDSGEEAGSPYYIAEYCENGDLSRRNLSGFTTLQKILLYRQVCDAVAAAHEAGIIHRDIKPPNVLIRREGSVAVGDFGLCFHLADSDDRITAPSEAVGARDYIAPEMEDGRLENPKPSADVYSLGKLLYFILGGRSLSREKHRTAPHDLLNANPYKVDVGIRFAYELLDKTIVENPDGRYQNAAELRDALDGVITKVEKNAHVLDLKVRQPCLYCVSGEYRPMQGSGDQHDLKLICWNCGNIQNFGNTRVGIQNWWMTS